MQKRKSRFCAVAMSLMMVLACTVPSRVMAAETAIPEQISDVVYEADNAETDVVSPRAVTYLVNKMSGDAWMGISNYNVTPGAGKNLKIVINSPSCNVYVYVNGSLKKVVTSGSGSNTYDLVNNCGSGSYTVSLQQEAGQLVFFAIVSTDYT